MKLPSPTPAMRIFQNKVRKKLKPRRRSVEPIGPVNIPAQRNVKEVFMGLHPALSAQLSFILGPLRGEQEERPRVPRASSPERH